MLLVGARGGCSWLVLKQPVSPRAVAAVAAAAGDLDHSGLGASMMVHASLGLEQQQQLQGYIQDMVVRGDGRWGAGRRTTVAPAEGTAACTGRGWLRFC